MIRPDLAHIEHRTNRLDLQRWAGVLRVSGMALGPEVLMGDVIGDIPVAARPLDFEIWVVDGRP